jgi:hypothetical protein
MRNLALYLLVFALAVLSVVGIGAKQERDKLSKRQEAALKLIDEQLPIVDLNAPKPTEPAARAKREAKDRRHDLHKQPIMERNAFLTTVYHWSEDFPPLPIEQSTTIIVGKVSESNAHISDDRSSVYSEVVVTVEEVLKSTREISKTIVAERDGGRVRFPTGTIFRYIIDGINIPKPDHRYLLFLKQLDDGDFSIVTGYELVDGRVMPLDDTSVVPFAKYQGSDENTFLSEVRNSIKNQTSQLKD